MDDEYSYTKKSILQSLSENSRVTVTELAKQARCTRNTVVSNLASLEKEFGLKYTVEFEQRLLGMDQNHIVTVKTDKGLNEDFVRSVFKEDKVAQLAIVTEGDFDLLVYALTASGEEYMRWETKLSVQLSKYGAEMRPSQLVTEHTGFVPLISSSLERVDFERFGFDDTDKRILTLLNDNSRMSYSEIARNMEIGEDKIKYKFGKICKTGIIKKFTAIMTKPPKKCNSAVMVNYCFSSGIDRRMKTAREYILESDRQLSIENISRLSRH